MNIVVADMLNSMEKLNLPNVAKLWQPFLVKGCSVYVMSDYKMRVRDDLALHLVSRLFPATDPTKLALLPVIRGLHIPTISENNLIVLGRIHTFKNPQLSHELITKVHKHAHYRFIDNQTIIDMVRGNQWVRIEEDELKIGYGLFRFWRQNNRYIINFCGAGAVGTLAATMAMTQFDKPLIHQIEQSLHHVDFQKVDFLEVLVKGQWEAKTPTDIVVPATVSVKMIHSQNATTKGERPLPWIRFERTKKVGQVQFAAFIGTPSIGEKLFTVIPTQVAILAAIAQRSDKVPSTSIEMGGFLGYEQISASSIVNKMMGRVPASVIRTNISRIRKQLEHATWRSMCPGFLLQGSADAGPKRGRKKQLFRLRASAQWEPKAWWD